jgi:serine protease inhibitor
MLRRGIEVLVLVCSAGCNGEWMREWLGSIGEGSNKKYDLAVTRDFIRNSSAKHSSVFSPVVSEMNVLLQALGSEYGVEVEPVEKHMGEVVRIVCGDRKILRAVNAAYIPRRMDIDCSKLKSVGTLKRYSSSERYNISGRDEDDCEELFKEDEKWVKKESGGKLQSTLELIHLTLESRVYSSIAYFKDMRCHKFDKNCTKERDFHVNREERVKRMFMEMSEELYLYSHSCDDRHKEFHMVGLPYEGDSGRRLMVYLVPKTGGPQDKEETDLAKMWDEFSRLVEEKRIAELLGATREVHLRVPRIEGLETKVNLKKVLKDTYGDGPGKIVESMMTSRIDVDEEGTEAASYVFTDIPMGDMADGVMVMADRPYISLMYDKLMVTADRPYISLVYDKLTDRILFVVKDMGRIK